eukprot:TRINITY_DN81604_c0_g1_i1.p1 TRINITY_DN81604_c0_g1~~TRINITY_DN81604_c0_g1_i1.p1  ORF type:complete len:311 (-),score=12.54 TRINITY_DN81604_c0_g1_i1:360-1292(-)
MRHELALTLRASLGIVGTCVVGFQSLVVRLDLALSGVVAPFCCLIFALIMLDMYTSGDKAGATWCQRYSTTAGVLVGQLVVCIGSFWCAAADMLEIFSHVGCGPCKDYSLDALNIQHFFKAIYYFHVIPCFVVGALGPLQFYEPLRKRSSFLIHRWIGRLLLVGSIFQQSTASVMITMYMVKGSFRGGDPFLSRVYHASLYVLNVYAWVAVIVGWRAAVRKDIPIHGAHMHRLGAAWCAIVVGYRIVQPPLVLLLGGNDWAAAIAGWLIDVVVIGFTELYLRKSGRFAAPALSARCPLTASRGEECAGRQ